MSGDLLSQEQVRALLAGGRRRGRRDNSVTTPAPNRPKCGEMNKLESRYANYLELLRRKGELLAFCYEPFNLRLGDRCYYRIDFLVITAGEGQRVEFHEVKGHWEDDARVKFKVAVDKFPWFTFVAAQQHRGEWVFERYEARQ